MRAVVQRVKDARVTVNGELTGKIGRGLLVFLAVTPATPKQTLTIWQRRLWGSGSSTMRMGR